MADLHARLHERAGIWGEPVDLSGGFADFPRLGPVAGYNGIVMTLILNNPSKPHLKRWTKQEYHAEVDRGSFRRQRIFLYRGELIEMPPMGSLHRFGIANLTDWLSRVFAPEHRILIQCPFETPGESVPEPDGAVVTHEQMRRRPHPNQALLLIEVADSSIELDREKAFDYAAAQVPEYWIVNMQNRNVEVYREPVTDTTALLGFRYSSHRICGQGETISSLLRPDDSVAVASLVAVE
jgi:Uma2 family endonuclease